MRLLFILLLYPLIILAAPIDQTAEQRQIMNIADAYEKAYFTYDPEEGLRLGRTEVALDRFTDRSLNARAAWQQQEDQFLAMLQKIDTEALKGTHQYVTYQLLKQSLENERAVRLCEMHLWAVNPLIGWHIRLGSVAEKQPIGTPELRAAALNRWRTFDKVVDQEIDNLKIGMQKGVTAPQSAVNRVLKQIHLLIEMPTQSSPYFDFAKRDTDPLFKKQVANIIEQTIYPALKRYALFLEKEYLPQAREKIGLSALPNGEQCYQAKVLQQTTLTISPEDIHRYGLQHMQQIIQEVADIGKKEFGVEEISLVFKRAKQDSQYLFHSEQEMLAYNQAALQRAQAKAPQWFNVFPKSEGIIKPYPLHRAQTGAPGEYHQPSDDGLRPGIFYINTYQPEKRSRVDQEATLFHELIPGHHFQIALSYEDKSHHALNKFIKNPGYCEGWALYVERLADEMGLYQDNISRLGMLSNEAMRAARLVVDPGIHVMGWTREQAIDYMKKHTAMAENIIEAEVDRYAMLPGQATSYMLGKREIETLRAEAKQALGERFDIREYHWQVLKNGTVTLPMLRDQINDWIQVSLADKARKT